MAQERELVRLDNLGEGAAAELFELELQRVLDNIQDVNTKAGMTVVPMAGKEAK